MDSLIVKMTFTKGLPKPNVLIVNWVMHSSLTTQPNLTFSYKVKLIIDIFVHPYRHSSDCDR
jgi:hypothetical protein